MGQQGKLSIKKNMYLFAVGVFLTKILNFVFAPIYSHYLSTSEFGTIDILSTTVFLIIPIFTLAISEALLKYGLSDQEKLNRTFNSGLIVCLSGTIGIAVFTVISGQFIYQDNLIPVCLYFCLESIFVYFQTLARAKKNTMAYVISSVSYSVFSIVMIMLFVSWRRYGVNGYFYGLSIGVFVSIVLLFFMCNVGKMLSFKSIDLNIAAKMIKYSAPLVLANVSYWIISGSDKYITGIVLGSHFNGILSVVHKIPTICTLLFSIFNYAYVMSALSDHPLNKETYEEDCIFYSSLFKYVFLVLIIGSMMVSLLSYPVTMLFDVDYQSAWVYIPLYSFGVILGEMRNFFISIYCTKEKTFKIMLIVFIGAVINALTCYLLMKFTSIGLWATAFSTIFANGFIFIFFYFDIRRYVVLKFGIKEIAEILVCFALSFLLFFNAIQSQILIYHLVALGIFFVICACNYKDILEIFKKMLPFKFNKKVKIES